MEQKIQEKPRSNGAIPKCFKTQNDIFEFREESDTNNSRRTTNPFKSKALSKYINLIDQSDVKWYAEVSRRSSGGFESEEAASRTNITRDKKNLKKNLSYFPIKCPISNCEIQFLPNDMIMHFLSFHRSRHAPIQRLYEKQRLLLTVEPFQLVYEEIACLGLLSYIGKNGERIWNLAERNLCVEQNVVLLKEFEHLKYDYPIYILASVISMDFLSSGKGDEKNGLKMLILWLAGANTDVPLTCTITAYDESRLYSRSIIAGLHSIFECQNPNEFCKSKNTYFRLHFEELSSFVNNDMSLKIEFVFHEDFG